MIKSFVLGAKEYTVEEPENIDDTGLGRCYSFRNLIKVAKKSYGEVIPESERDQTFYHELTHAILDELGRSDLSKDENLVQSFSLLLHQFQVTKK